MRKEIGERSSRMLPDRFSIVFQGLGRILTVRTKESTKNHPAPSTLKPLINGAPLMSRAPPTQGAIIFQAFPSKKPCFLVDSPPKTTVSEDKTLKSVGLSRCKAAKR